jgi:hypothetical protein
MSHFDNKSEVINIQLTSYGKHLLSKGKFKPVYYAFFDDEIIYDSRFLNLSESQNDIQERILNESLSKKPQVNFIGVEDRIINTEKMLVGDKYYNVSNQQNSIEKNYSLSMPLGKSSHNSEYYPAWNLQLQEGKILNAKSYIDNSNSSLDSLQPYFKLPQIQLSQSVYDVVIKKDEEYKEEGYQFLFSPYVDKNEKEYYFSVKKNDILIDLSEINVDDIKENFDIEVFIEEEKQVTGKSETIKIWKQLFFPKEKVYIKNDILLDEPENANVDKLTVDSTFVEHYIDILTDEQLALTPKQLAKLNIYVPSATKTPYGEDC